MGLVEKYLEIEKAHEDVCEQLRNKIRFIHDNVGKDYRTDDSWFDSDYTILTEVRKEGEFVVVSYDYFRHIDYDDKLYTKKELLDMPEEEILKNKDALKTELETYNQEQYHRAIELAVQAVHDNNVSLYRWLSIQEVYSLQEIYHSYGDLLDECISSVVCKASNGLVIVDTDYEKIFCMGEYVSFKDIEGTEHKLKFKWFLSPDLKELKEYFANYKRVNRLQQIDKCKDDIEKYKKWILESEETLKKLEEEEDQ